MNAQQSKGEPVTRPRRRVTPDEEPNIVQLVSCYQFYQLVARSSNDPLTMSKDKALPLLSACDLLATLARIYFSREK